MLKELLDVRRISLHQSVKNWREAVKKVGKLFEETGVATEEYTQAMIETVETYGAYIVIDKGVALPHARPERGAKENALAIMTLTEPVEFGSDENDPVWIVLALAAKDNNSHLESLSSLAEIMDDENFVEDLKSISNEEEMLSWWKEKEEQC